MFGMFCSVIGIANTDQIILSVIKKPLFSAVPHQAFQVLSIRNAQIWQKQLILFLGYFSPLSSDFALFLFWIHLS